jgi:hypothetical protein
MNYQFLFYIIKNNGKFFLLLLNLKQTGLQFKDLTKFNLINEMIDRNKHNLHQNHQTVENFSIAELLF